MARQEEAWEVRYELRNEGDGMTVARGHVKDYPSAEEAMIRLGERIAAAVAGELRSVADPAPWRLVLTFEVSKRADPFTEAELVKALATAGWGRPNQAAEATSQDDAEGIDLNSPDPDDDSEGRFNHNL
jgi:hypothetical protein